MSHALASTKSVGSRVTQPELHRVESPHWALTDEEYTLNLKLQALASLTLHPDIAQSTQNEGLEVSV